MRTLVLLAFLLAASGCGSSVSLQSSQADDPVTVDAQLDEWSGKLQRLDDGLSVGIQNDDGFLYVALSTRNANTIGRIMQSGLIVWIDPEGGKAQTFGVRYPLGYAADANPEPGRGLAANRVRIEQSTQELEIVGEGGRSLRHGKDEVPGLAAHVEADRSVLTYELQVPLGFREGLRYAVDAGPGGTVGIGLTTSQLDAPSDAHLPGSGGLPGGRMASADGQRGAGGRSYVASASMKHWMVVTLAE